MESYSEQSKVGRTHSFSDSLEYITPNNHQHLQHDSSLNYALNHESSYSNSLTDSPTWSTNMARKPVRNGPILLRLPHTIASKMKKTFVRLCLLSCTLTLCIFFYAKTFHIGLPFNGPIGPRESGVSFFPLETFRSWNTSGEKRRRLPTCIIFGVSKCGTRALSEFITLHPDVFEPPYEINFYINDELMAKGMDWYLQQMPETLPHQVTVEKSPDYFQHHISADYIYKTNKNVKLILLLREPVERVVSEYMQLRAKKRSTMAAFEDWAVDNTTGEINTKTPSIMVSAYADHVEYWLKVFPRHQFHVVESDSLRYNPYKEVKRLENFLNLTPYFTPGDFYYNSTRKFFCMDDRKVGTKRCLGKSKGVEHVQVDEKVLTKLRLFYAPYNKRLKQLLNVSFPWT